MGFIEKYYISFWTTFLSCSQYVIITESSLVGQEMFQFFKTGSLFLTRHLSLESGGGPSHKMNFNILTHCWTDSGSSRVGYLHIWTNWWRQQQINNSSQPFVSCRRDTSHADVCKLMWRTASADKRILWEFVTLLSGDARYILIGHYSSNLFYFSFHRELLSRPKTGVGEGGAKLPLLPRQTSVGSSSGSETTQTCH